MASKNLLKLLNKYSLEFYYLISTKPNKRKDIYQNLLSGNKESLLKMVPVIKDNKQKELISKCSKYEYLDEIIYDQTKLFHHLREIRNIVNLDAMIDIVIPDIIYHKKVKLYYLDMILDSFVEEFYDYESIKQISKFKEELINENRILNSKIIDNINRFYIQKITI